MNKKLEVGDVFEIETKKGCFYVQYKFYQKGMGELIRVMPGVYRSRPENLKDLIQEDELYETFFILKPTYKAGMIERVANFPVKDSSKPKYMRSSVIFKNRFLGWVIVDTDTLKRQYVYKLNKDQIKLSPFGIWNLAFLIDRIEEGWSLKNWQERVEKVFGPPQKPTKDDLLI